MQMKKKSYNNITEASKGINSEMCNFAQDNINKYLHVHNVKNVTKFGTFYRIIFRKVTCDVMI